MKKTYFILFAIILLFTACHEYYYEPGYPCDFCYTIEPEEGILFINLSISDNQSGIPIVIYKDILDYKDTIWTDTAYEKLYDIGVPINEKYTVTAEYEVDGKKVLAVDAARVFMRKNTTDCDEECWIIYDGNIDIELKYDDL